MTKNVQIVNANIFPPKVSLSLVNQYPSRRQKAATVVTPIIPAQEYNVNALMKSPRSIAGLCGMRANILLVLNIGTNCMSSDLATFHV